MERIKESVTPSGVEFSVRNLIGEDQDKLSEGAGEDGESNPINDMLFRALRKLGNKSGTELTPNVVKRILSNDKKFILLTMREHTLGYQRLFKFKYDWPLRKGFIDKQVVPYEVKFSPENFPIEPYHWVKNEIQRLISDNKDYVKPDGHKILFPIMYPSYDTMLTTEKEINGVNPITNTEYRWFLLDGEQEEKFSKKKMVVNDMLEMRRLNLRIADSVSGEKQWAMIETKKVDIMEIEHIRTEIREKEGTVDTFLTIQNPSDARTVQVDLVSLPVFFFPSQAQ